MIVDTVTHQARQEIVNNEDEVINSGGDETLLDNVPIDNIVLWVAIALGEVLILQFVTEIFWKLFVCSR